MIPTPTSLSRLWHLAGTGMHDANRYAPPAPSLPGLLLLAAAGVGITAVLADLIAVPLRSTALAGLPLLVLFTVPVTMNASHDQLTTSVVFCLSGVGYLTMLSADGRERIRVWGRLVSLWRSAPRYGRAHDDGALDDGALDDGAFHGGQGFDENGRPGAPRPGSGRRPGPDTRALAAAGRRVGLASIVLALFAPLIVPGLHASKLFSSGPGIGGRGGTGGGQSLSLPSALSQAVAQLHESQPRTVFTYTTNATAAQQASDAEYFRQYVFDTLGDSGWQVDNYAARSVSVSAIPGPPGLTDVAGVQTVRTSVTVGKDFRSPSSQPTFLPLPYPAIQVSVPGHVDGRSRSHGVLHQRLHRRAVLHGGQRGGGPEPRAAGFGTRGGADGRPGPGSAAARGLPDDGPEEARGAKCGRPDHRVRQGERAGQLAVRLAVHLQPRRPAADQRIQPGELPDQGQERLLRAVRVRDDRADP